MIKKWFKRKKLTPEEQQAQIYGVVYPKTPPAPPKMQTANGSTITCNGFPNQNPGTSGFKFVSKDMVDAIGKYQDLFDETSDGFDMDSWRELKKMQRRQQTRINTLLKMDDEDIRALDSDYEFKVDLVGDEIKELRELIWYENLITKGYKDDDSENSDTDTEKTGE